MSFMEVGAGFEPAHTIKRLLGATVTIHPLILILRGATLMLIRSLTAGFASKRCSVPPDSESNLYEVSDSPGGDGSPILTRWTTGRETVVTG